MASGRKLPLAQVQDIAKGRVWTGADASRGDWSTSSADSGRRLPSAPNSRGMPADERVVFKRYPQSEGFLQALRDAVGGTEAGMRVVEGLSALAQAPAAHAVLKSLSEVPRGSVEMRATNLPIQ